MKKMDSFLEEPRCIPKPTPIVQEIEQPTVPEVSLMFQNHRKEKSSIPINFGKSIHSYNAWKLRNNMQNTQEYDSFLLTDTNKENLISDKSFLNKKQVRFESTVPHYPLPKQDIKKPTQPLVENHLKYSEYNKMNDKHNAGHCSPNISKQTSSITSPLEIRQAMSLPSSKIDGAVKSVNKPFDNLYMSNLPNRELDLSFLEPQKAPCLPIQTQNYNIPNKIFEYKCTNETNTPQKINANISTTLTTEPPVKTLTNFEIKQILNPEPVQQPNESHVQEQANVTLNTTSNTTKLDDCEKPRKCDKKKKPGKKVKQTKNDAITVNELLNIIKLQNEQLQKLQSQVDKLVEMNEKTIEEKMQKTVEDTLQMTLEEKLQKVIESSCREKKDNSETCNEQNKAVTCSDQPAENNKKISVGMMTSFEFSFKPPITKKKNKKNRNRPPVNDEESFSNSDCKSMGHYRQKQQEQMRRYKKEQQQELFQQYQQQQYKKQLQMQQQQQLYEQQQQQYFQHQQQQQLYQEQKYKKVFQNQNWNHNANIQETEYSLGPQDDLEIQEPPESPENSIHIDMQEYDTETSGEECSTDEGWTFYKDILGKVNNLLDNSRPNCKLQKSNKIYNENFNNCTLDEIKLATMQQLQSNENDKIQMKPTEVSFAVKQILMKYLPDEGLADVATQPERNPTDISIAAFKYMQQCNVRKAPPYYGRKGRKDPPVKTDPKILDITTLKQQPKFL